MAVIYGWTRHYIIWELSVQQMLNHHKWGMKYDMYRRGYVKNYEDDTTKEDRQSLREFYYTKEELAEYNKERDLRLKKRFGNNIEGL